jgi:hypothetical protein
MPWSDSFDDPIPAKGRTLFTLECAAKFIKRLPNAEQETQHWQTAIGQLIDAAEGRNLVMHARIGMLKALTHGHLRPAASPRKKVAKSHGMVR